MVHGWQSGPKHAKAHWTQWALTTGGLGIFVGGFGLLAFEPPSEVLPLRESGERWVVQLCLQWVLLDCLGGRQGRHDVTGCYVITASRSYCALAMISDWG